MPDEVLDNDNRFFRLPDVDAKPEEDPANVTSAVVTVRSEAALESPKETACRLANLDNNDVAVDKPADVA